MPDQAISSRKVIVYFYQGPQGGGSFHFTNARGRLSNSPDVPKARPFASIEEAVEMFREIAEEYMTQ
jgi:hypothetical protein